MSQASMNITAVKSSSVWHQLYLHIIQEVWLEEDTT